MPSTYTNNLGIELIATGEQSGTWGDTTNTNWQLADESINGVTTVNIPAVGSTGSPNDLPVTDGASSSGRNKFIEFTDGGDLGGTAYVRLTPNDAEKIVHIRNSLTAARDIIIFQGTYNAANDFTIPNGADVLLKFNGGGASATASDVFVNLTATGITTTDVTTDTITATTYNNIPGQTVDALTDTTITGPATNDLLQWNGSAWVDVTLAEAGIGTSDVATIQDLTNVTITGPTTNDLLQWNGSAWVDRTLAEAGIGSSDVTTLDGLSDTVITGPTANDLLQWNGAEWVDVSLTEAGIGAAGTYDYAVADLANAVVFDNIDVANGLVTAVGTRTLTLANLGYTGSTDANTYVHPTNVTTNINTSGADIVDIITTSSEGHITAMSTRTLTLANLGYTGTTDANTYVHPTHPGDDLDIDTTLLSGATVISDLDINITTDTLGHVTDANATVATRALTPADIGAAEITDSIIAGTGMTGGGTLAASRTLNVIGGTGITANANDISIDSTVVTLAGTQTLTGTKTLNNITMKEIHETEYSLTGTVIDPLNGSIQYKTLGANTTFTSNMANGQSVTLKILDGTNYTITWPTMEWVGGAAPTLDTTNDTWIELWRVAGTIYGTLIGVTS